MSCRNVLLSFYVAQMSFYYHIYIVIIVFTVLVYLSNMLTQMNLKISKHSFRGSWKCTYVTKCILVVILKSLKSLRPSIGTTLNTEYVDLQWVWKEWVQSYESVCLELRERMYSQESVCHESLERKSWASRA